MPDIGSASTSVTVAVNCGSSSLKINVLTFAGTPTSVLAATIDGLGTRSPRLAVTPAGRQPSAPEPVDVTDHASAGRVLIQVLQPDLARYRVAAVAHRLVHGGTFRRSLLITSDVVSTLRTLVPLAPNHLPDELAVIDVFARHYAGVPQVACFDTAFHRDLPAVAYSLPVPQVPGPPLRKYGFHGLSYTYLLEALERMHGAAAARGRVILAHLGSGASLAAVSGGRCLDTTMGLTPSGGLVMSSRAGDLDPGVVTYLARVGNLSIEEVDLLLTRRSGLLALSGHSADMQELLSREGQDPRAQLAVEVFCYQVRKWIGAMTAALGGVDTIVFAGGIGEHAPTVRARVCAGLGFLGVSLDPVSNHQNAARISRSESRVSVHVIPTDESITMAKDAHTVLTGANT